MDNPVQEKNYVYGARLSGLLVNVGTVTVKKLLERYAKRDERVTKVAKSPEYLNILPVQILLRKFKQAIELANSKKQLFKEQYVVLQKVMNGEEGTNSFDLTLLTRLFGLLKLAGYSPSPSDEDKRVTRDLNSLRMLRNSLYGHIVSTGLSKDEFDAEFKKLSEILIRLGAPPDDVAEWKKRFCKQEDWQKELKALVLHDMDQVVELKGEMIKKLTSLEEFISETNNATHAEIRRLQDEVCLLAPLHEGFAEKVLELFENALQEDILRSGFMKTLNNIQNMSSEHDRKLDRVLQETERTRRLVEQQQFLCGKASQSLLLIRDRLLEKAEDSFKILITTTVNDEVLTNESFEDLARACGSYAWNVIIDWNHLSQTNRGIFDLLSGSLCKEIDIHVIPYDQTKNLTPTEKTFVACGQKCLWILANGSPNENCDPCVCSEKGIKKYGKATVPIQQLLVEIMGEIANKKPVVIVFLLMNNDSIEADAVKHTRTLLEAACQSLEENITIDCSYSCALIVYGMDTAWKLVELDIFCDPGREEAPAMQITEVFRDFIKSTEERFSLPGNKSDLSFSSSRLARLRPWMEVYHKSIGKIAFDEQKYDEIRLKFLKGSSITVEALWLQENGTVPVYVKRKLFGEIEARLRKEMTRYSQTFSGIKHGLSGIINIYHEPSAGGTTCGRHLLYAFRNEYPCFEIKKIGSQVSDDLVTIFHESQKPLLLMIDGDHIAVSDVMSMQRTLENKCARALIFCVKRGKPGIQASDAFYLPLEVSDIEERTNFKRLYESAKARTVFQFGLYKFLESYEKLQEHVDDCMNESIDLQRRVLRLVYVTRYYSSNGVPMACIFRFIDETGPAEIYNEQTLFKKLGPVGELVVVENPVCNDQEYVKPAHCCLLSHVFRVFNPIWEVTQGPPDEEMDLFLEDLKFLIKKDLEGARHAYSVIQSLCFTVVEYKQQKGQYWSAFVLDLQLRGNDFVSKTISEFVQLGTKMKPTQGHWAHLRGLNARFLIRECRNVDKAIAEIRLAVGLHDDDTASSPNGSKNSHLWDMYGTVYKKVAELVFDKCRTQSFREGLDQAINQFCETLTEAARGYERSRTCVDSFCNPYPYCNEAEMKAMALEKVLNHKFKNDRAIFSEYVDCDEANLFLKDAYHSAMRVLDELDFQIHIGRVPADKEEQSMDESIKAKFRLFSVGVHIKGTGVESLLDAIKTCAPNRVHDYASYICKQMNSNILMLPVHCLQLVFDKTREQILMSSRTPMTRESYKKIITAMIVLNVHLKDENTLRKCNIDYAIQCAEKWKKDHKDDIEAEFYLGVLKFTKAVGAENGEEVKKACDTLRNASIAYKKLKDLPGRNQTLFKLAQGIDLQKLKPNAISFMEAVDLQVFNGRQVDKNKVSLECGGYFFHAKTVSSNDYDTGRQQRTVRCTVGIARNRILALNLDYTTMD